MLAGGISGPYNPYAFSTGFGAAGQAQPAFRTAAGAQSGANGAPAGQPQAGINGAPAGQPQAGINGAPAGQPQFSINGAPAARQGAGVSDGYKVKGGYKSSPAECQTCKERKYQDGSNEADVSFKSPGHIVPQASAATVMAHEQQHVANAYQKAADKGGQVVSCSVSLHTAVCPECGTVYVSGGTTNTAISYPDESNPYQKDKKAQDGIRLIGANIDYAA